MKARPKPCGRPDASRPLQEETDWRHPTCAHPVSRWGLRLVPRIAWRLGESEDHNAWQRLNFADSGGPARNRDIINRLESSPTRTRTWDLVNRDLEALP
jgi:hypothetical protein